AQAALEDPHPRVRAAAVRILESFLNTHADEVLRLFTELTEMESAPYVKLQLLASLGESGEADALHLMARILDEHSTDPYFQEMALSGSYQREGELQSILHRDFQWNEGDAERKDYVLTRLAEIAGDSGEQKVSTSSGQNENHLYRSGENIYQTCMACHGVRGEGIEGVATPLDGSPWVNSDPAILVRIILQGFANEETETNHEVMPAHRFLQDEEIAAVLTYIRQSWSNYSPAVTVEEVSGIREETRERRLEWTPGELRDLQDGNGQ
ncbi:MAG: c-type cytochrome, partial [Balneolaceae bacterium]